MDLSFFSTSSKNVDLFDLNPYWLSLIAHVCQYVFNLSQNKSLKTEKALILDDNSIINR